MHLFVNFQAINASTPCLLQPHRGPEATDTDSGRLIGACSSAEGEYMRFISTSPRSLVHL